MTSRSEIINECFLCTRGLKDFVDLPGTEAVRPFRFGFFANDFQNFGLGGGEAHIVSNAKQHGARSAALLNDERSPLLFYSAGGFQSWFGRGGRGRRALLSSVF